MIIYNAATRKKEEFIPQEKGKVKMYACGITASGDAHIGHAFQACVFDMITKYMTFRGYDVTYVRNYTDVEDKIIAKANELGVDATEFAKKMIIKTNKELDDLGVDRPTIQSKATECMGDIINLIKVLEDKGFAYRVDNGDVFFDVKKFPEYGKFSHRSLDDSIDGFRIEVNSNKADTRDFALWKSAKPGEIFWESPWGKGRPGWHIECSAMSMKYLGETLDIHGGGKDLIFPHHENEIAQSEAATGKPFVKYWIHNGLIKVNSQKMSKSFGNGILLQDIQAKYCRDVIRITLHQNSYRSDVNVVDGIFEQHEKKVYEMYKSFKTIKDMTGDLTVDADNEYDKTVEEEFVSAMDNDFNTSVAISNLFKYLNELAKLIDKKDYQHGLNLMHSIKKYYAILGIGQLDPEEAITQIRTKYLSKNGITEQEIDELINERLEYKNVRNYEKADEIKQTILEKGILIKDSREGTTWDIMIN